MSTHNLCFEQKYENISFLSENFPCLDVKFFMYFNRHVFLMFVEKPPRTENSIILMVNPFTLSGLLRQVCL